MIIRQQIIDSAREWIGTPYQHHQAVKGLAADCLGLVGSIAIELGIGGNYTLKNFKPYAGYGRNPNPKQMLKAMEAFLVPVEVPLIGDIAWMEPRKGLPCHLALKSGEHTIIHACSLAGKVIESPLNEPPHSWWKYGGLYE